VKKLGIAPGSTLALIGAPDGFRRELIGLPRDVRVRSRVGAAPDLIVWFVRNRRTLDAGIADVSETMGKGLWLAWPKRATGLAPDLSEDVIRGAGLAHGLVDYKVCAMNDVWSGLKFARRNPDGGR
jgi:hypothetical protein